MELDSWLPAEWLKRPATPGAVRLSVVYDPDMGAVAVAEWPDGRVTTGADPARDRQ